MVEVRLPALERLNRIDPLEVFTVFDGQVVAAGDLVASVKVAPHLVPEARARAGERIARARRPGRAGPRRSAPVRVAVVVKGDVAPAARERFEAAVRAKVAGLGAPLGEIATWPTTIGAVAAALRAADRAGRGRADLVLTAGGASTDPADPFFTAIDALGGAHRPPRRPGPPGLHALARPRRARTTVVGPAQLRRLLEGDGGGPAAAAAGRGPAGRPPRPSPGSPTAGSSAEPAVPVPGLRPRARRARRLRGAAPPSRPRVRGTAARQRTRVAHQPPLRPGGVASAPMGSDQPVSAAAAAATRSAAREDRPEATRSIEGIADAFRGHGYIADRSLATTVFLALELGRPLLLEGEAGVGKTELAKVLAASLGTRLIRLQCYEGLDVNTAVYEWNYPRQMLEIRLLEARGEIEQGHRPTTSSGLTSCSSARCSRRWRTTTGRRPSC